MKLILIIYIFIFFGLYTLKGQIVVFNEKLYFQLTKNQAVRIQSNQLFFNSYEKQRKLYDEINQKILQAVAIQDYIYKQLTNVNYAIKQSKQMYYVYQNLGKISKNSEKMLSLSTKHPEYAVLLTRYYNQITLESLKLKNELSEEILKEAHDFLIDPYDRQMLINNIFMRLRIINGAILYINLRLENGNKTPYLYQVPRINNYVNIDRSIIKDIVYKYKLLTN
ncbi:hypothetical protein [Cloacibacterium normanense]|uniref:hypothetical protein n=1 Tax=Cloacibacterium normanense TaxID=237258 RepID=UPI0039191A8B